MSAWVPDRQDWRPFVPDAIAGMVVFVLGLWEIDHDTSQTSTAGAVLVVVGLALAVAVTRRAPGAGLGLAWLIGGVHVFTGTGPMVTEVLLAYVAFGCARWAARTSSG